MAALLYFDEVTELNRRRRERVFRERTDQLNSLTDEELVARYRLPRHAIQRLLEAVKPYLQPTTSRSMAMSAETQLLLTLRYLSKGGFLMELGDLHGVSEPSVCRAFHRTINALCETLPPITFPGAEAQQKIKQDFYRMASFPKVVGAIDGTIISIKRPSEDEPAYVCRKGFHALNVQAVCDSNLRFLNAVVKWPGSCHDAFMLANSELGQALEDNLLHGDWLLGDSGYPCRPWLLTPIHEPQTRGEERYNKAHIHTRNSIERAFGVLKSRFRCLHKSTGCIQFSPHKAAKIIMAAILLHNFCLDMKIPNPENIDDDDDDPDIFNVNDEVINLGGIQVRQAVVNNVFS